MKTPLSRRKPEPFRLMSNPPKKRNQTFDNRAHDTDEPHLAAVVRQSGLDKARVDPLNQDPMLACVLAGIIMRDASEHARDSAGKMLVGAVENFTADEAEAFFRRIVSLKRNHENLRHRNGFAVFAYSRFIEETGKEPTKSELRKFVVARPETFKDQPGAEDKKGWTRLWKDSGLFALPDR